MHSHSLSTAATEPAPLLGCGALGASVEVFAPAPGLGSWCCPQQVRCPGPCASCRPSIAPAAQLDKVPGQLHETWTCALTSLVCPNSSNERRACTCPAADGNGSGHKKDGSQTSSSKLPNTCGPSRAGGSGSSVGGKRNVPWGLGEGLGMFTQQPVLLKAQAPGHGEDVWRRRWKGTGSCRRPLSSWSPDSWEGAGRVGVWAVKQGPLTGASQNCHEGVGSCLAMGLGAKHTELDPKQSGRDPGGELGN